MFCCGCFLLVLRQSGWGSPQSPLCPLLQLSPLLCVLIQVRTQTKDQGPLFPRWALCGFGFSLSVRVLSGWRAKTAISLRVWPGAVVTGEGQRLFGCWLPVVQMGTVCCGVSTATGIFKLCKHRQQTFCLSVCFTSPHSCRLCTCEYLSVCLHQELCLCWSRSAEELSSDLQFSNWTPTLLFFSCCTEMMCSQIIF